MISKVGVVVNRQPFQICYALVSGGKDRFAPMAYLSARAFQRIHPEGNIFLVCDSETHGALKEHYPKLLDAVHEVVPVETDIADKRIRSRYLKVILRERIRGDFVYLDVDTLPIRRFDDITQGPWDVAAVQDRNHHGPITPVFPPPLPPLFEKLGWRCPLPKYFNSGVVFFRDNPAVHGLAREWEKRWRELFKVGREDDDQCALSSSLFEVPVRVQELPPCYNAMVTVAACHARNARIYHFFAGNVSSLNDSLLEHLLTHLQTTGEIDWKAIDRCVAMDYPWMPPYWIPRLWQTGNYRKALGLAARKLFKKKAISRTAEGAP